MTDDHVGPDTGSFEIAEITHDQALEPIVLAKLVPRYASPLLNRPIVPASADPEMTVDVGPIVRTSARVLAPAAALAIGVLIVWGLSWALLIGALGSLTRVLAWLAHRAEFSFGDGFLSFRPDRSWPRGVQEEYDVAWAWPEGTR